MKRPEELVDKQYKMLKFLSHLPRKIIDLHGVDNATEFVLHDLCHEDCFNLKKAAYFIDNPDFNCTKGVAGYSRQEPYEGANIWESPQAFSNHMKSSSFNGKVRQLNRCSLKNVHDMHAQLAQELAHDLGFANYGYCTWRMKHDNDGFVVYEKAIADETFADEYLVNGLTLLSFCPVF